MASNNQLRDIFTSFFGRGDSSQPTSYFVNTIDRTTAAGQAVTVDNATENPTVLSCVTVLSQGVAQLPYGVHVDINGLNTVDMNHPITRLFNRPNGYQTPFDFKSGIVKDLKIHGNSFTRIIRTASGTPVQLLPIDPSDMAVSSNEFGFPVYRHDRFGEMDASEIVHIKEGAGHTLIGESPVIRAKEIIGGLNAANKMISETFQYGVSANYVISMDGDLDDTKHRRIQEGLQSFRDGGSRRGGVAVIEGGSMTSMKGSTPADTDLRELRANLINEIAAVFRVPADMAGADAAVTYNNVSARLSSFYRDSLQPIICSIEEAFSAALLNDDERLGFDVSQLLRGDSASQISYVAQARSAGVMTINDALGYLGENRVDDPSADVYPSMTSSASPAPAIDDETDVGNLGNIGGTQ